jgi:pimeloyl-ACP methyl ester carboxylesterase
MMKLDRELVRPGARVRFADAGGGGIPVILTHGAGMDHSMFAAQADAVAGAGYRPILWDLRGHGQSSLDEHGRFAASDALADLGALIESCGLVPPVLVGHSLGGNLSQAHVRRHPDSTAGLIVIDATWNAGPLTRLERFGLRLAAPALGLIPARSLPRLMAKASAVTPEGIAATEAVFARMPKRTFLDVWRATVSFVEPDPGYRSPARLALIRGAADRTGNIATAMSAWAAAEGVGEHVIADAGHVVTLDAPEAATAALLDALREVTA